MTAKKPLPEIARCAGRPVKLCQGTRIAGNRPVFRVHEIGAGKWIGPTRNTARGAIRAWNRVMGQNWDTARLLLCYRLLKLNRRGGIDAVLDEIDKVIGGE